MKMDVSHWSTKESLHRIKCFRNVHVFIFIDRKFNANYKFDGSTSRIRRMVLMLLLLLQSTHFASIVTTDAII